MRRADDITRARYLRRCRLLVVLCTVTAAFYLRWLLVDAQPANAFLFRVLVAAEVFNIIQAAGFWYTISIQRWTDPVDADPSTTTETVDALVTVCGEPADVVEESVRAVAGMRHPRLTVWVLDDGPSAEIAAVAESLGVRYLTRPDRRGAKAGNINEALKQAHADYVAIFDADHAPLPEFLLRTLACFDDERTAFVQTPQSYRNRYTNRVAAGAHEQQDFFYGPILRGKDSVGAVFSCGTNVVFRRRAIDDVGGIPEDSITEDLRISLMLSRRGWTSRYLPEVLAYGLGPVDVAGFFKQQSRWARGGLEIAFRKRPFHRGMGVGAALQYALSFIYWFTGWAYVGYLLLPTAFLVFGLRPVQVPNEYPIHFFPYVLTTILTMVYASGFNLTFRALWFTLASFPVHISALVSSLFGVKSRFFVTPKVAGRSSPLVVWPHLAALAVVLFSVPIGLGLNGLTPSVLNNVAFAFGHALILSGFVRLAIDPTVQTAEGTSGVREQAEWRLPELEGATLQPVARRESDGVLTDQGWRESGTAHRVPVADED